jgi:hypothetical protein
MASLAIRTELFEHIIYPSQTKLTSSILINLFKSLHLLSSIDYKITLNQWIEQAVKHIPSLVEGEAEVYFKTYKAILAEIENPSSSFDKAGASEKGGKEEEAIESSAADENDVDVRCFALFMAVQLFTQTAKYSSETRSNLTNTAWPSMVSTNINISER